MKQGKLSKILNIVEPGTLPVVAVAMFFILTLYIIEVGA